MTPEFLYAIRDNQFGEGKRIVAVAERGFAHPETGSGHCWHSHKDGALFCCLCVAKGMAKLEKEQNK